MSRESRRERVRELLERLGLGAALLKSPANFAWYTGGADNRVDHAAPAGVAGILLTPEAEYVLTDNIEAPRFRREVTPELEVAEHPWYEPPDATLRELSGGAPLGTDEPGAELAAEVSELRRVLDPEAIERYRRVGEDATAAVREAAEYLTPGTTEQEAAAQLAAAGRRRGLFAPVLMAAGWERLRLYRHPIPAPEARLGERAMLVVCAERGGLYANLTRFVHFERPDSGLERRLAACEEILHRMREEATRPGRTLGEAFADCRRFYEEAGFPEGWRDHHQGGLTGYASREVIATPESPYGIRANQAFAWNPSLPGAKAEETFILSPDGPEVIAG